MEDRPNWLSGRRPTSLSGAFARTTSSDSGSSLGSPSPAAKPRWNTDYAGKLHTRASSEDLTEDENTKPSYARPQLSPNSRRLRNQELMKRALAAPPLFVNRGQRDKPTFASANRARREMGARIEQTTRELARKSSMSSMGSKGSLNDDDQPLPPPNVPKSWGSRAKKQPHWIQKILSPDLPGATQEEMDVLFQKPHPPPFNGDNNSNNPPLTVDTGAHELTPPASRPASVQPQYIENNHYEASRQRQNVDNDYYTGSAASIQSEQPDYADEDSFSTRSASSIRSQQPQEADDDYFTRSLAGVEPQTKENPALSASNQYQSQDLEDAPVSPTDDQFTSRSIEISQSPAIRIRTTLLDEIREREIETLSARAVATNRLGEIRERNSEERDISPTSVKRFSKSPTPAPSKGSNMSRPKEATEEIPYNPHYKTILEEEGYPIPGTPVWVMSEEAYQKKTGCGPYVPDPEGTFQTLRQLAKVASTQNSPAEQKVEDDHDLTEKMEQQMTEIQKLPESVEVVSPAEERRVEQQPAEPTLRNKLLDVGGSSKRHSTGSDIDPEDRITAEAKLFELQDNKSERNSWSAPSRSRSLSPIGNDKETPKPVKVDPLCLPTPKVTGAYIETPAPSERKPRKQRSRSSRNAFNREGKRNSSGDSSGSEEDVVPRTAPSHQIASEATRQPQLTASRRGSVDARISQTSSRRSSDNESQQRPDSPHPENTRRASLPLINTATIYSAAEDVRQLERAAGLEDSGLDDSTLDEFAVTMDQNATSPSATDRIDSLIYDETGFPLSPKQRAQKLEMLHYERMSKRLYNTSSGIRQTTRGITRITNTLTTMPDPIPQPDVKPVVIAPLEPLVTLGGITAPDGKAPRSTKMKFGIESNAVEVDFKFDIKWSNLFWQDTEHFSARGGHGSSWNSKRRLTWVGLICVMVLLSVTWFIAESATCSIFCRPKYASGNRWNYQDPSFPFAIPTKIDQWTGSIFSTGLTNTYDYFEGLAARGGTDDILEAGTFDDDEIYD